MKWLPKISLFFLALGVASPVYPVFSLLPTGEERWNWDNININEDNCFERLSFPKNFQWGVASSAFQIEGTQTARDQHIENNWTIDKSLPQAGIACEHWDRYKEDVQLLKNLGINTYRLSISWEKIEPEKGRFDADAMHHYQDLIDELIANGIQPVVCLFHHTWPVWFDKKGAFERKENNADFIEYCDYVFEKLHNKVKRWMTFNEPVGYCMAAYIIGENPPKKKTLKLAGIVVNNMLNAHVDIYQHWKEIDNNAQIGFAKVFHPLHPYHIYNPVERGICSFFNHLLHDVTINFFKTGEFNWAYLVKDYNPKAPASLDYIGVNYYTHTYLSQSWTGKPGKVNKRSFEIVADTGKAIYPEGLSWSIKKASELHLPIFVSENGIADKKDQYRKQYLMNHLYVIDKLKNLYGYDIRGYDHWSFEDCYNWNTGYTAKYGLYAVNFDNPNKERTLRPSAELFKKIIQECKES